MGFKSLIVWLGLACIFIFSSSQIALANISSIKERFAFSITGGHIILPKESRIFAGIAAKIAISQRDDAVEAVWDAGNNGFQNFNLHLILQGRIFYFLVGGGVLKFDKDYERRFNMGFGFKFPINRRSRRFYIKPEVDFGILPGRYEGLTNIDKPESPFGTWNVRLSMEFWGREK